MQLISLYFGMALEIIRNTVGLWRTMFSNAVHLFELMTSRRRARWLMMLLLPSVGGVDEVIVLPLFDLGLLRLIGCVGWVGLDL